jgi:acyl carrier protein
MEEQNCETRERLRALVEPLIDVEVTVRPIPAERNLSEMGVGSVHMVDLMLAMEAEFDLTIPVEMINPENFLSIETLTALVVELTT